MSTASLSDSGTFSRTGFYNWRFMPLLLGMILLILVAPLPLFGKGAGGGGGRGGSNPGKAVGNPGLGNNGQGIEGRGNAGGGGNQGGEGNQGGGGNQGSGGAGTSSPVSTSSAVGTSLGHGISNVSGISNVGRKSGESDSGGGVGIGGSGIDIVQSAVQGPTTERLPKVRIPYLAELALDIDKDLIEQVRLNPVAAVRRYEKAVSEKKAKTNAKVQNEAITKLGHVYYLTGQLNKAVDQYREALSKAKEMESVSAEASAFRNLGAALSAEAEYEEASENDQAALRMFSDAGNHLGTLMVLNNLGVLAKNRGRHADALEFYSKALDSDQQPSEMKLMCLTNLGNLRKTRGENSKAAHSYKAALEVARTLRDRQKEADVLLELAKFYEDTGHYDLALENGKKSLDLLKMIGAQTQRSRKVIGDVYLDLGKVREAEPYLKEANYDSSLGRLYLFKSHFKLARQHFERLIAASRQAGNLDELFAAYTGLATVREAVHDYDAAEAAYSKAIETNEQTRSSLLMAERKNFFASKVNGFSRADPAKGLSRVRLKQNRGEESVYPAEAARARDFADNISTRVEGSYFRVPEAVLKTEEKTNNKLASLRMARSVLPEGLDRKRFSGLTDQITKAEEERNAFLGVLQKDYPEYAAVRYPRPLKLEETAIRDGEYVLFFDVLNGGVGTRLIEGRSVVLADFMNWDQKDLERDVEAFRKSFEEALLDKLDLRLASELYDRLLRKALDKVPDGRPVIIVPDGILGVLPFEALVVEGSPRWQVSTSGPYPTGLVYAGDRHPFTYYQSLTALTLTRSMNKSRPSGSRVLVMADPVFDQSDQRVEAVRMIPASSRSSSTGGLMGIYQESGEPVQLARLEGTEVLAKRLSELYGDACEVHTGLESTKDLFLKRMNTSTPAYNSIVLATHGFAYNNIPGIMEPAIVLTMVPEGTDGLLTLSEVAGMKTNADIAALTACQTGLGERLAGEGILSMGRAFQCAGARSVLVSLWSVAERSSVSLMEEFFRQKKTGKSSIEACVAARQKLRKEGFEHPFFWASFILVGEAD